MGLLWVVLGGFGRCAPASHASFRCRSDAKTPESYPAALPWLRDPGSCSSCSSPSSPGAAHPGILGKFGPLPQNESRGLTRRAMSSGHAPKSRWHVPFAFLFGLASSAGARKFAGAGCSSRNAGDVTASCSCVSRRSPVDGRHASSQPELAAAAASPAVWLCLF